jgi:hypothetical protein
MRRLALTIVVLLLLAGCNGDPPSDTPATADGAQSACAPEETFPPQGEGHLVGDQKPPVPYNSTPPTSGWHASGDVPIAVAPVDKPLTEPEQVTVLELGGVVVSYKELPAEDVATLTSLVTEQLAGRAALTRYDKLKPGEIALTGWGVLQRCTSIDEAAITAFAGAHAEL